jgi:hypothetical protein
MIVYVAASIVFQPSYGSRSPAAGFSFSKKTMLFSFFAMTYPVNQKNI